MATPSEERERELNKLNEFLDKLSQITTESLIRPELGVDLNFENGRIAFGETLELFRELKKYNFDGVSTKALTRAATTAERALDDFTKILDFSLDNYPQNPKGQRDQFINDVEGRYDEHFQLINPLITFCARKGPDLKTLEARAKQALQEVNDIKDNMIEVLQTSYDESEEMLDKIRQATGEAGVAQHAIFFEQESKDHQRYARNWLVATVVTGILTLGYTLAFVFGHFSHVSDFSLPNSIQLGIAKVLTFSVLSFSLLWASKNYRAHRHNTVVNKHRYNAMRTFEAFVKATDDESTKNAVLLKATETIFSHEISGYLTKEPDQIGNPQFLEIIRQVAGKPHD